MGSREAKKLVTRRSMVDAAARLFAERGVDGTTMDDIAQAAGTSRTSVFNYFGYKEMILCEIGARYVEELAGSMLSVARRSARQRLIDLADLVAELANREPELISPIVREMTHPDPKRRRQASATMQYRRVVETSLDMLEATGRLAQPATASQLRSDDRRHGGRNRDPRGGGVSASQPAGRAPALRRRLPGRGAGAGLIGPRTATLR